MVINDNLFSVSQSFLAPDIVQKVSDIIGQSADKTKKALKSVIPALLSGITDKGSTPEGAATLVDMVNTHNYEANMKPDVAKLSEGNEVVNNIFGSNLNNVVSNLGTSTGLSGPSISKILSLAAPVLMGVLGLKVKNEKLSSSGLMNFLGQEKKTLSGYSAGVSQYSELLGDKARQEIVPKHLTQEVPWKRIALAALILFALWFWWMATHPKMEVPLTKVVEPIPIQRTAVNLVSSSLNELSAFMAAGTIAELPKHFRFEKLTFASGTTVLASGAELELNKIASAMKQYPMSKARLEGYTDNVGLEESNRILSASRADAVKAQLVARGIDGNRIQTVGLGSGNPVGNNATAEGRAVNRRIEFVVTNIK